MRDDVSHLEENRDFKESYDQEIRGRERRRGREREEKKKKRKEKEKKSHLLGRCPSQKENKKIEEGGSRKDKQVHK